MVTHRNISRVVLALVVILLGGSFFYWAQKRPSSIFFQIKQNQARGNQSAVITQYQKLLLQKDLSEEEEINIRRELGIFYWESVQREGTLFLRGIPQPELKVDHPFLAKSKAEFEKVLEKKPQDALSHLYLGLMQLIQGKEQFGLDELTLSHQYDPTLPHPLFYLALVHFDRGKEDEALQLIHQCLSMAPGFDRARMLLVRIYGEQGQIENAKKEFFRLSAEYKSLPHIRSEYAILMAQQNQWGDAIREIEGALQSDGGNGWVQLNYGRILLERGLMEEAGGAFSQAAVILPHSPWPIYWQGELYSRLGNCEKSSKAARILNEALPRWPWTHLSRAWAHICRGDSNLALEALNQAVYFSPTLSLPRILRAQILLDKGEFGELGSILKFLINQKKSEGQAHLFLGQSFFAQGQWELAEETFHAALKVNPRDPLAQAWTGLVLAHRGQFKEGEKFLWKANELKPSDGLVRAYYALFESMKGDIPLAENLILQATQLNVHEPGIWVIKGDILFRSQKYREAIQAYNSAIHLRPYLLAGHLGLIRSYEELNERKMAHLEWNKAKEINPNHPLVLEYQKKWGGS